MPTRSQDSESAHQHPLDSHSVVALVVGGVSFLVYGATLVGYLREDYVSLAGGTVDRQVFVNHVLAVITSFFILVSLLHPRLLGLVATAFSLMTTAISAYTKGTFSLIFFSAVFVLPSVYISRGGSPSDLPKRGSRIKLLIVGLVLAIGVGFSFVVGIASQ